MPLRTISIHGIQHALDVRPDRLDLRDRPYTPPTSSLPARWPLDQDVKRFLPAYVKAGLIQDQGQEGACTGFGLAAVVNYLLWLRSGAAQVKSKTAQKPKPFKRVSPYMLYDLARFYDEWPGQDYEGSSCRGAMKGWHKHGVCAETLWARSIYPSTTSAAGSGKAFEKSIRASKKMAASAPDRDWPTDAASRPIGVYYRIDKRSVTDMQAAIYDVGAIYVSCMVHSGWDTLSKRAKNQAVTHASLPRIDYSAKREPVGGHAFAIVGYNEDGFVVQNSWGTAWGQSGFAVLTYDDWVAHGTDAWVCSLGVPQNLDTRKATPVSPTRATSGASLLSGDSSLRVKPVHPNAAPWSTAQALQHSIVAGNDGEVVISRPDHATPKISVDALVANFKAWAEDWQRKHPGQQPKLAIYTHGGLNSESSSIERARVLGPYFKNNGVYPIFYIWKTGVLEVLRQEAMDNMQLDPSQSHATGFLGDARDRLIEVLAHGPFRFMWKQMKQNAQAARGSDRALGLLKRALDDLSKKLSFETHLVAHSAGSFVTGHLLDMGLRATSLSLFAPACSLEFALARITPHAPKGRTALHLLTAELEAKDPTGLKPPLAYGKSLLWLVARGFEDRRKTPLAGFAHCLNPNAMNPDDDLWRSEFWPQVGQWRRWTKSLAPLPDHTHAVQLTTCHNVSPKKTITGTHGGFDNDRDVMSRTIALMTGHPANALPVPIEDLDY